MKAPNTDTAIATVALSQFLFAPVYANGVDGLQSGGRLFPYLPLYRIKYATFERGWECVSFHLFDFPACLFCEGAKTGRKGRMAGTVYCVRFLAHSFDGSGFYARRSPLAQRAIVKMQGLVGEVVNRGCFAPRVGRRHLVWLCHNILGRRVKVVQSTRALCRIGNRCRIRAKRA